MEATSTATSTATFTAKVRRSSVSKLLNFNRKTLMRAWVLEIDVRHALKGIRNRRTYNYEYILGKWFAFVRERAHS